MEKLPRRVPTGDVDLVGLLVDHFFGDLFGGFDGIADVIGNIGNAITGASSPGTGSPLDDIMDHILGIQNVGVENATSIAAINAALGGEAGSGVYFVDTFDRADSASLGSDWTVADPSSVGIAISSNQAVAGTAASGSVFAACNTIALGDNMSVAAVIGDPLSGLFYDTALHVRMNTTQTAWVYLNVFKNKVYLGRATRSGSSSTYTDWVSVTSGISITNGTQVELRAEGTTYRAYVGGKLVAAFTDAAVSHPVGASYRSTGFKVRNDSIGRSLALSSFAMADITVPATLGTGWNLYRSSTSGSSSTSWTTSGAAFGSNTFDVEDRKANVVVDNLGLGRIKTLKAGWYTVTAHAVTNTGIALGGVGLLGGTSTGSMSMIKLGQVGPDSDESYDDFTGNNTTSTNGKTFGATWIVYCPADYYLQPCGWKQSSSASMSLVGNPAGYNTNFSGALTG